MSTQIFSGTPAEKPGRFVGKVFICDEALSINSGIMSVSRYTKKAIEQLQERKKLYAGLLKGFSAFSKKNRNVIQPILTMFEELLVEIDGISTKAVGDFFKIHIGVPNGVEFEMMCDEIMKVYTTLVLILESFNKKIKAHLASNFISLEDQKIVSETEKYIGLTIEIFTSSLNKLFPSLAF